LGGCHRGAHKKKGPLLLEEDREGSERKSAGSRRLTNKKVELGSRSVQTGQKDGRGQLRGPAASKREISRVRDKGFTRSCGGRTGWTDNRGRAGREWAGVDGRRRSEVGQGGLGVFAKNDRAHREETRGSRINYGQNLEVPKRE